MMLEERSHRGQLPDSIDAATTVSGDVAMKSLSITTNEERTNEERRMETNGSPMRKCKIERIKFIKPVDVECSCCYMFC